MLLLANTPVTHPPHSRGLVLSREHKTQEKTRLLLPDVPVTHPPHSTSHVLDEKRWSQKRTKLHIGRGSESMDIRFWASFDRSMWNQLDKIVQAGTYIGLYYESWVRRLLASHPDISTAKKITQIQLQTNQILAQNKKDRFHRCLPDLLIERDTGDIAFLEIKASAPWNGPVIYRDAFEWYQRYQELGIPVYFFFIEHPVKDSQKRFNASAASKHQLYEDLRTPNSVHIVPASMVEYLYHAVPAAEINDKRRGRLFKRLRMSQIQHVSKLCQSSHPAHMVALQTRLLAQTILKG